MSPFAPLSVYKNRISEGATLILTLGGLKLAIENPPIVATLWTEFDNHSSRTAIEIEVSDGFWSFMAG